MIKFWVELFLGLMVLVYVLFVCVDVDLVPRPVRSYVQQMRVGWFLS